MVIKSDAKGITIHISGYPPHFSKVKDVQQRVGRLSQPLCSRPMGHHNRLGTYFESGCKMRKGNKNVSLSTVVLLKLLLHRAIPIVNFPYALDARDNL